MRNFYALSLAFIISVASIHMVQAATRYVNLNNTSGAAPYTSWSTAGNTIQAVINESVAGDEIWVTAGTYKPNSIPPGATPSNNGSLTVLNDRDYTFFVKDGVKIYGGFTGTETLFSQRNITVNETILSGDIGIPGDMSDNSYHIIVSADGNIGTVIDGFTFVKGNADNYSGGMMINNHFIYRACGGGVYSGYGRSTITNSKFYDIYGGSGGAVYLQYGYNTVSNNLMYNNTANYGSGIHTDHDTSVFSGNVIYNSSALVDGGAIITYYSNITVSNNKIYNNTASRAGGVMVTSGSSTFTGNIIYKNKSTSGIAGGIFLNYGTNIFLNNVLYENNAYSAGGAVYSAGNNTFTNTIVYKNSSYTGGGGFFLGAGTHILNNNTLYSNSASVNGGGIYTSNGNSILKNNIFWDNKKGTSASVAGADYFNLSNSTAVSFSNNLLQLPNASYTTASFNSLGSNPQGNIFAQNPDFGNPASPLRADGIPLTADDGLALQNSSICRSAGTSSGTPDFDCTGAPRTGIPNMGAYEVVFTTLDLSETGTESTLRIFPNPAKEILYFSEELTNIQVYSMEGRALNIPATKKDADLSQLQKGLYIITGKDKNGNKVSQKIIKE
ncbi:right-handed parallel beta-helix repeat-containing protein [Chryseobacterium sp. JJR-5R]|uniref:right-handed parallel beta-helix repeat-containing protein n=1 Tax=Chryseobacterium sp. JJR-5R TaxID=3093923 RepID=UPI002A75E22F|nr:right-handed parallel beta-helix repeat-containing protein [Chryseobacterium sp. JJR-5R]WPO82811.1 right-handed parallel beta-helix repeat-containing protein [Chryseobacterium sp. JJR-5R]